MPSIRRLAYRLFGTGRTGTCIGLYAARAAYLFLTAALMIWSIYALVAARSITIGFILFIASQVVYWIAYLYYRQRTGD